MSLERTLSIIKPDATSKNIIGKIIDRFEESGLKIVAGKLIHMDEAKAAGFYAEHEDPSFQTLWNT
jgi:nucleoside-diphosphate kinase